MTVLIGLRLQRFRVMPIAVLDLAPALAIFRTEVIAQNGEQPGGHVGAGLEGVDIGERTQQRFLHQVIRTIHVPTQGNRECAEARHRTENGFADRTRPWALLRVLFSAAFEAIDQVAKPIRYALVYDIVVHGSQLLAEPGLHVPAELSPASH